MTETEAILYIQKLITEKCVRQKNTLNIVFADDKSVGVRCYEPDSCSEDLELKNMEEFINWLKE